MHRSFRCISITDRHGGRYPNNGGEYAYIRFLYRKRGAWEVKYYTSAEMQSSYCPVCGVWQRCTGCPDASPQGECGATPETMTRAEVASLVERFGITTGRHGVGIIDATGHMFTPCGVDGGCTICYPCNHEGCGE